MKDMQEKINKMNSYNLRLQRSQNSKYLVQQYYQGFLVSQHCTWLNKNNKIIVVIEHKCTSPIFGDS